MTDIMIGAMFKMAEDKKTLPGDWWERYKVELRKPWQYAYEAGRIKKVIIDFFDCEITGKPCPVCNTKPVPFQKEIKFGDHVLGDFDFYRMECDCEEELKAKEAREREIMKRITEAEIPDEFIPISWTDWNPNVNPELTGSFRKIQGLSYGAGLERTIGAGMMILGDVGRGKTMAAMCWVKTVLENTKNRCKYLAMSDFSRKIRSEGQGGSYLDHIEKYDILFLDDIDKLSMSSEWVQERVFSLFDYFHKTKGKTLILTSNLKTREELETFFGRNGEAIFSRMFGKMEFIKFFGGDDYRKKRRMEQKRKENS